MNHALRDAEASHKQKTGEAGAAGSHLDIRRNLIWIENSGPYDDFSLLLSAEGIIQHSPPGYSSYSNVPAMAKGIPLLSTYEGRGHRFSTLISSGSDLPVEFHRCRRTKRFVSKVSERIDARLLVRNISS